MNGDVGSLALFGGLSIVFLIAILVIVAVWTFVIVFYIVGQWKMFSKAGEEGWKSLIPVYNYVILSKLVGVNPWWLLVIGILYLCVMLPILNFIVALPCMAAYYYYFIILGIATARSYGKKDEWAIGFILMPWLFYFLVGNNKEDKYIGVAEVKDPVWGWFKKTFGSKGNDTVENTENVKFCAKCGSKIDKESKFCPICGEKI